MVILSLIPGSHQTGFATLRHNTLTILKRAIGYGKVSQRSGLVKVLMPGLHQIGFVTLIDIIH